jgi:hypothetical protein
MGRNYRTARCKSTSNSPSWRLPAHQPEHRPAWEKTGDATRSRHDYPDALFCAKLGFPVKAGVLPTIPLQTASAATPLPPRRPTPMIKPVEIPEVASTQPVPAPRAIITPDFPAARPQKPSLQHAIPSVDNATADKSPPFIRNKRVKRPSMPPRSRVFAALVSIILAIAGGASWWFGSAGNTRFVQALPSSVDAPSSGVKTSADSSSTARSKQHHYQAAATGTHASSGKKGSYLKEIHRRTEPPHSLQVSGRQPDAVVDTRSASAVTSRPATADASTSTTSKEQSGEKQNRRAPQRNVTASGKDRLDEVSRLGAKASSETSKGRAGTAKASQKPFASKRQVKQASSKRSSGNANLLVQKASLANEFKQCKSRPSLLQREKCKWRICAGKWGKNGCPAYNHDVARY